MHIPKRKLLAPLIALVVWVMLIALFGLFSHFSWAGFSLVVYVLCVLIYDSIQASRTRTLLAITGFVVSCLNVVNAFYLEAQGLPFKGFLILFSLACAYAFLKMSREAAAR
ncbi:hypothetical protein [Saccharibacillus deserti]|uniref:hypothetical protein n=1 Tax=Saccharibacillus deserti TaxID=1634444 RepID=UPI001553EDFE|nr:hypothetical protein [Saccharibacillus deserti]